MTAAQFEDAEGRALVEAIHQRNGYRPPLQLIVHPPIPPCPEQSGWGFARDDWFEDRAAERKLSLKKRLTEAELAAECWHFDYEDFDRTRRMDPDECTDEEWAEYIDRRNEAEAALSRFATLPHYDE